MLCGQGKEGFCWLHPGLLAELEITVKLRPLIPFWMLNVGEAAHLETLKWLRTVSTVSVVSLI